MTCFGQQKIISDNEWLLEPKLPETPQLPLSVSWDLLLPSKKPRLSFWRATWRRTKEP